MKTLIITSIAIVQHSTSGKGCDCLECHAIRKIRARQATARARVSTAAALAHIGGVL